LIVPPSREARPRLNPESRFAQGDFVRQPPGEPVTMNSLPLFVTIIGLIELNIRLSAAI